MDEATGDIHAKWGGDNYFAMSKYKKTFENVFIRIKLLPMALLKYAEMHFKY